MTAALERQNKNRDALKKTSPAAADEAPIIINDYLALQKETERFREAERQVNLAYDKAEIDDYKNAAALKSEIVKGMYAQGLITEQQSLDRQYQIQKEQSDSYAQTGFFNQLYCFLLEFFCVVLSRDRHVNSSCGVSTYHIWCPLFSAYIS